MTGEVDGTLDGNLSGVPDSGVPITADEIARRWRPWTPDELHERLAAVSAAWGIAGGWAVDLFLGEITRAHDDIDMTVPAASFPVVAGVLEDFEWDVVGDGRLWPYPAALDRYRQTWLKDPSTGNYLLDVIREPHDDEVWIYRRNPSIRMPLSLVYQRTDAGIPFVTPEIVLLFKSSGRRPKDELDFDRAVRSLTAQRRARLVGWLRTVQPEHPWIGRLDR